jgi:hypothetical protein
VSSRSPWSWSRSSLPLLLLPRPLRILTASLPHSLAEVV